ncbi:MAG TPA: PDZ domain-containing protein [Pirellulales bacterium]
MARWLLIIVSLLPASAVFAAEEEAPKPLETFPVATRGNMVLLPVRVWDQSRILLFDTGASTTCFDLSERKRLGSDIGEVRIHAALGSLLTNAYSAPAMTLGNLPLLPTMRVVCFNLAPLREAADTDFDAILGIESLMPFIVQIDFDRGVLKVFAAGSSDPAWGDPVPLWFNPRGNPKMELTLCGVKRTYLIDTGADGIFIDRRLCAKLTELGKLRPVGSGAQLGLLGRMESTTYAAGQVELGRFKHSNLRVDDGQNNIVGLKYLARYCVTFDFPNRTLYLRPGVRYSDPDDDPKDLSGLHVIESHGKLRIDWIDDGGPAEAAGLQVGDQIARVDRKDAAGYRLLELRKLFASREGRKIQLTTIRAGETREVEIILRAPTPPSEKADAGRAPKTE